MKFKWFNRVIGPMLIGLALGFWLITRMPLQRGGPPIPKAPPSENDRVVHELGFSIVKPPGWVDSSDFEALFLSANRSARGDFINVFFGTADENRSLPVQTNSAFQGKPALIESHVSSRDGHAFLFSSIVFEREGQTFEIMHRHWADQPPRTMPPEIMQYLETFMYNPAQTRRSEHVNEK